MLVPETAGEPDPPAPEVVRCLFNSSRLLSCLPTDVTREVKPPLELFVVKSSVLGGGAGLKYKYKIPSIK